MPFFVRILKSENLLSMLICVLGPLQKTITPTSGWVKCFLTYCRKKHGMFFPMTLSLRNSEFVWMRYMHRKLACSNKKMTNLDFWRVFWTFYTLLNLICFREFIEKTPNWFGLCNWKLTLGFYSGERNRKKKRKSKIHLFEGNDWGFHLEFYSTRYVRLS